MARKKTSKPKQRAKAKRNADSESNDLLPVAVERVDVLCGCGWGRLQCPENEVPSECPLCGMAFDREIFVQENPDAVLENPRLSIPEVRSSRMIEAERRLPAPGRYRVDAWCPCGWSRSGVETSVISQECPDCSRPIIEKPFVPNPRTSRGAFAQNPTGATECRDCGEPSRIKGRCRTCHTQRSAHEHYLDEARRDDYGRGTTGGGFSPLGRGDPSGRRLNATECRDCGEPARIQGRCRTCYRQRQAVERDMAEARHDDEGRGSLGGGCSPRGFHDAGVQRSGRRLNGPSRRNAWSYTAGSTPDARLWRCPSCRKLSAWNWQDAEEAQAHLGEEVAVAHGSAFDNQCGHCNTNFVKRSSPIMAKAYTHENPRSRRGRVGSTRRNDAAAHHGAVVIEVDVGVNGSIDDVLNNQGVTEAQVDAALEKVDFARSSDVRKDVEEILRRAGIQSVAETESAKGMIRLVYTVPATHNPVVVGAALKKYFKGQRDVRVSALK